MSRSAARAPPARVPSRVWRRDRVEPRVRPPPRPLRGARAEAGRHHVELREPRAARHAVPRRRGLLAAARGARLVGVVRGPRDLRHLLLDARVGQLRLGAALQVPRHHTAYGSASYAMRYDLQSADILVYCFTRSAMICRVPTFLFIALLAA